MDQTCYCHQKDLHRSDPQTCERTLANEIVFGTVAMSTTVNSSLSFASVTVIWTMFHASNAIQQPASAVVGTLDIFFEKGPTSTNVLSATGTQFCVETVELIAVRVQPIRFNEH